MTKPKSQPKHCIHPPETFTLPLDGSFDTGWTVDMDFSSGWWQFTCHQCRERFEYSVRPAADGYQRYALFGSDCACPTPTKIGFATEEEALAGASEKGERYKRMYGVYLCQCETWHLTTER